MKLLTKTILGITLLSTCALSGCRQAEVPHKTPDKAATSTTSHAQQAKSGVAIDRNAQAELNTALAHTNFTGTAIIVRNGQTIARVRAGFAQAAKLKRNDYNTTFEIDSIQKSMTGALLMRQIQAGKLRLNTLLSTYYPNVPGASRITMRQLLDMNSGLALQRFPAPHYVNDQVLVQEFIKHTHFTATMWNQWAYQPVNYVLIAGILEKITGLTYQQLYTRTYIQGMGLKHTHFAFEPDTPDRAQGYVWDKELQQANFQKRWNATFDMEHYELGTGQVFMNANDLYRVESAIVSGRLLGKTATDVLHWPGSKSTYGGGFYHHNGYSGAQGYGYGYEGFVRISPNGKNAVIFLANAQPNKQIFLKAANKLALHYAH